MNKQDNQSWAKSLTEQLSEFQEMISAFEKAIEKFKRLDEALKEFQSMVAHFSKIANEGIVLVQDLQYVWANRSACEILGYSEQDLLKLSVRDTTVPDMRDKLVAVENFILSGSDFQQPTEWLALRGDRTLRYLRALGYPVKYQGRGALLTVFYDVTEERKLHEELQLRAQILDSVTDSVFLLDKTGKIVYVNEAAYTTRGYTKEELLGKNIIGITPDAYKRRARILLTQISEHKNTRFDTAHICKDGSNMLIEVNAKAIRINKTIHYLGVTREKRSATEFTVG